MYRKKRLECNKVRIRIPLSIMLAGNVASHLKSLQHDFVMARVTISDSLQLLSCKNNWKDFAWYMSLLKTPCLLLSLSGTKMC